MSCNLGDHYQQKSKSTFSDKKVCNSKCDLCIGCQDFWIRNNIWKFYILTFKRGDLFLLIMIIILGYKLSLWGDFGLAFIQSVVFSMPLALSALGILWWNGKQNKLSENYQPVF